MGDTITEEEKARHRGLAAADAEQERVRADIAAGTYTTEPAEVLRRLREKIEKALAAPAPPAGNWSRAYADGQREAYERVLATMKEMGA